MDYGNFFALALVAVVAILLPLGHTADFQARLVVSSLDSQVALVVFRGLFQE